MAKRKWILIPLLAIVAVIVAVYGQKDRENIAEAKPYVPQPLIILNGDTITYNDAPDCH
ncbi:hypothetical protein [Paenibacillus ginsengarvi]|uniref:hypothetical protein n=1 Tax=Paenibacillus ginsengarvi TaxID=400777 RepID=UPI001315471A|nr:hypothetical protein [Paenibacillus ginsengarvi]